MSTASLPLRSRPRVPAPVPSLARQAPRWTGRGRTPSPLPGAGPVLFLVEDGVVLVATAAPSGRVVGAALLGTGDVWTGHAGPSVRMDALCPASVSFIDRADVTAAIATDPEAAGWLADG